MERNLDFLFLAGFMSTAGTIQKLFPQFAAILEHTLSGESGYGRQLTDALEFKTTITVHSTNCYHLLSVKRLERTTHGYTWGF